MHEDNHFVTLTYRDASGCTSDQLRRRQHLPDDGSLNKKHFQKFIRSVRKANKKVRYFHCGEYGDQTFRPHYHACLFGLNIPDLKLYRTTEAGNLYTSEFLSRHWKFGFVTVGELNFDTAAYTARYILKKVNGARADDHYMRADEYGVAYWLQPEYVTMSLKPGIGAEFFRKYESDFFPSDQSPVPGKGNINKIPRYYESLVDEKILETAKQKRQEYLAKHKDDFSPDRLMARYKVMKAKMSQKKRDL